MSSEVYRAKLCAQIQQNDTKLITERFTVEMDNDPKCAGKLLQKSFLRKRNGIFFDG